MTVPLFSIQPEHVTIYMCRPLSPGEIKLHLITVEIRNVANMCMHLQD
jgi:hypothetical protein